jgi:hypothetical protein
VRKPKKEAQCYTQAEKAVKKNEDRGLQIIFHFPFAISHFSLSLLGFVSPTMANEKCDMANGKLSSTP